MAYKTDIKEIDSDYSNEVTTKYQSAKQQLDMVQTANLEGTDRAKPSELKNKLEQTLTTFTQEKPKKLQDLQTRRESIKKKHLIFVIVQLALIVLGVLLLANEDARGFGVVLIIAGVICHFIFKSIDDKAAAALSGEWIGFFTQYASIFGGPETLHQPATGLYKDIDDLYLASLSEQARGFEMQSRQMRKQMEAQNEQHQQAMVMQQQQMEALNKMANEQKRMNDGLFGR